VQKLLTINSEDFLNPKGLAQVVKALVLEVCSLQGSTSPGCKQFFEATSLGEKASDLVWCTDLMRLVEVHAN
jgi:hypothetical protein